MPIFFSDISIENGFFARICVGHDTLHEFVYNVNMEWRGFGGKLRELREEKDLSREELANAIGTSLANIGRWEAGVHDPKIEFVVKISKYFEVSSDFLLGIKDEI
ncbi:MAG: helix-turn-helix transcriptional regulator [Firmicutes bacterium]|nr:helix-turn-helix transcriptional regulator [Bacillota bacterium]